MIKRLADEHKLDIRKWSAVSHVVALMYGQLAGCDSLNGIVDAARVHEGERRNIRGAQPPKRGVFAIDSSTIKLCLNCTDWARRRRKKAAAKLHMNLDVGGRLPAFAGLFRLLAD